MSKHLQRAGSGFELFERASPRKRRLLREEQLILQVGEAMAELLESEGVSRTELGRRLGKTKGFVSQILAGDKNLTLRTIADVCDALGCKARLDVRRDFAAQWSMVETMRVTNPITPLRVRDLTGVPTENITGPDQALGAA